MQPLYKTIDNMPASTAKPDMNEAGISMGEAKPEEVAEASPLSVPELLPPTLVLSPVLQVSLPLTTLFLRAVMGSQSKLEAAVSTTRAPAIELIESNSTLLTINTKLTDRREKLTWRSCR